MRVFFLLAAYLALSLGLYCLDSSWLGIPQPIENGRISIWQNSIELFAIPFFFLLFCRSKSSTLQWGRFFWSLWMSVLSFGLLWKVSQSFSSITNWGQGYIAIMGTLALSLALATLFDLSRGFQEEKKKLSELIIAQKNLNSLQAQKNQETPFQKVEGA